MFPHARAWKGKQHGPGVYTDPRKNSIKHGVWQNGKRLKWLEIDEINAINQYGFQAESYTMEELDTFKTGVGFNET